MTSIQKEERLKCLRKAQEIKNGIDKMVNAEHFKGGVSFKEGLKKNSLKMVQSMEHAMDQGEKEELLTALNKAKKATQKTRALIYDGIEDHTISKEDFDFFYNELAHLSSDIGKLKIHIQFPANFQ